MQAGFKKITVVNGIRRMDFYFAKSLLTQFAPLYYLPMSTTDEDARKIHCVDIRTIRLFIVWLRYRESHLETMLDRNYAKELYAFDFINLYAFAKVNYIDQLRDWVLDMFKYRLVSMLEDARSVALFGEFSVGSLGPYARGCCFISVDEIKRLCQDRGSEDKMRKPVASVIVIWEVSADVLSHYQAGFVKDARERAKMLGTLSGDQQAVIRCLKDVSLFQMNRRRAGSV